MAASVRSSFFDTSASVETIDLAMPAGAVLGDTLVATIGWSTAQPSSPVYTGWEVLPNTVAPETQTGGPNALCIYRVVQSGDTGPWTVSWTTASSLSWDVICIQDGDTSNPFDGSDNSNNAAATPHTTPSVSPSTSDGLMLAVFVSDAPGAGNVQQYSTPTDFSSLHASSPTANRATVAAFSKLLTASGATGTVSSTPDFTTNWIGYSIVMRASVTTRQVVAGAAAGLSVVASGPVCFGAGET